MKKIASAMVALAAVCGGLSISTGAHALEDLKPYYIAIEGSDLDLTFSADDDDDTPSRINADPKTFRVRAGWNFNDNLSLEVMYGEGGGEDLDFGDDSSLFFENDQAGGGDNFGPVSGELQRLTGAYVRYGGFALFEGFKLSGILGYTYRPRVSFNFENGPDGAFSLDEELESSLSWGFAASYHINKSLAFHFDWMHYADETFNFSDGPRVDPADSTSRPNGRKVNYRLEGISFGLSLSFGGGEDD